MLGSFESMFFLIHHSDVPHFISLIISCIGFLGLQESSIVDWVYT